MENRKLLYLVPPNTAPILVPDIQAARWKIHVTDNLDTARNMVESRDYHVGLALFNAQNKDYPPEKDLVSTQKNMKWIAMLPAECMHQEEISRVIRHHFYDFHTLPADVDRLLPVLGHAYGMASIWDELQPQNECYQGEDEMVGTSAAMQSLFTSLRKVASVDAPVLITGESGTGKELSARAIHERSNRSEGPFVAVNCGAIPANLVQSELFGYEKGAFTGATQRKIGRIESASGGTIFLDEIGDLPLDMQVNLLRFLQEQTIERVGATNSINVDVRVIAATHVNLEEAVGKGLFREDLYYRLNVLDVKMPSLRDRPEDIELLARYFFKKFSSDKNPLIQGFAPEALNTMNAYNWPGNVREMINRIRRAMVMCENRLITTHDLGFIKNMQMQSQITLEKIRTEAEKGAIIQTLRRTNNNLSQASCELGVSRMTLYRLMEKCGLRAP